MNMHLIRRCAMCALLPAALAGCATSQEARELATETAVAVQALDVALAANGQVTRAKAQAVSRRLTTLLLRTVNDQSELQARVDASASKADFQGLKEFVDEQEAMRQAGLSKAQDRAKAAADAQEVWKAPSAEMRHVSDKLTVLGREESLMERLKASAGFLKEVADRVKQSGEQAADPGNIPAAPEPAAGTP